MCRYLAKVAASRGHAEHAGSDTGLSYLRTDKEAVWLQQRWGRVLEVLGTHLPEADADMELGVQRFIRV